MNDQTTRVRFPRTGETGTWIRTDCYDNAVIRFDGDDWDDYIDVTHIVPIDENEQ